MAKTLPRTAGAAAHFQSSNGVSLSQDVLFDVFRGSANALIDRGIVLLEQLPGQPGKAKAMASFNADGSPRARGCSNDGWRTEGAKRIKRLANGRFEVQVTVSSVERARRISEAESNSSERLAHRMALQAISAASLSSIAALPVRRRPALRLVWSSAS